MYLKSLVLKGFKSFADRSVLTLEPGLTVVVGPNGSGKSNISDAVLWVLGEQSAKALRGSGMEDVIFSGSSSRRAVGLAEVDLVLDNSDGTLPLDFTEVVVTRRMYRSGESEYLVNGAPSRLMDVQEILNDCGLGRDTHSIISQGSLANVLRAKPTDRRVLIEEAAGLLKHKKRKERAAKKLTDMDAELVRVRDIAREIDRQLAPLERQATRAKRHDDIVRELDEVRLSLAVDDLRALRAEWSERESAEAAADAQVELMRYQVAERQRDLEKCQRLLEEKGLFAGDLAEQRSRCQSALERLGSGMLLVEEKGRNMVSRLSELRQSIHRYESRLADASSQLADLEERGRDTAATREELASQLARLEAEAAEAASTLAEADSRVASLAARERELAREADEAKLERLSAEESMESARTRDGLLEQRISQIDEGLATTRETLAARRSRLDEIDGDLAKLERESSLAKTDIDTRVRLEGDARGRLDAAREALASLEAELKGLTDVDRAVEDASPILAWSMERRESIRGFIAPVSEILNSPDDLEPLVEHLLGSDLFGLVVDDHTAAGSLVRDIADGGATGGEMSLFTLEGAKPRKVRAKIGERLIDKLSFEPAHRGVAELLLGDVYIVGSAEEAIEASLADGSGARFVTTDGVIAWPNGKVTIGERTTDARGLLGRKRRINALSDERPSRVTAVEEAQAALEEATDRLRAAQADDFDISQSIAQLSGERDSLREEIGRLEQSITSASAERRHIEETRGEIAESTSASTARIDSLAERLEEIGRQSAENAEELAAAREERETLAGRETTRNAAISSVKVELATADERASHIASSIESLTAESADISSTLAVTRETESSLELLRQRVEPLYAVFEELQSGITDKAASLRDRSRLEQAGQGDLRDTIEAARTAVREAQEKLDEATGKLGEVKVEKGRLEVKVEQAVHVITDDIGVLLDTALETPAPEDRSALESQRAALEKKLEKVGAVNPAAAEEYRELKERRDYITVQLDDLEGAAKSLERIVSAIDRKMRNRFTEVFEQVGSNFTEIFGELFPGGQAHLELTDPAHPEESGVEVHAQPRGKAVKKQTLLSGGEQSLVALALLFAVYRVRETPFYILDEVEAALDDTNLRRFLAYLDGVRDETQLIVISHQRRTMEMADLLYGVSMHDDGVSKLVSQKLDEAVRHAG